MVPVGNLRVRPAGYADADTIAALHADSWRRHYRGAYSDAFLDGDVVADRSEVWNQRLVTQDGDGYTLVAEDESGIVGFAHTIYDADPVWGSLLDNLHVRADRKRRGIGARLLVLTAAAIAQHGTGMFLWVLEQNTDAQSFYEACGGSCVERALASSGGVPGRLNGSPVKLRYVWDDPAGVRDSV